MKHEIEKPPSATLDKSSNIAHLLECMIKQGITSENVGAMDALVKLKERMDDKDSEKAFAAAFVALQAEMPKVQATKPVPNKDGTVRYHFAPFEEIMRQVQPMLLKHGFTVSFSTDYQVGPPQRLVKTCFLQHVGGYTRKNSFAVRVGSGPPGSSEAQGDGAASTYAKRFVLCDALNITVVGMDDDARAEGPVEVVSSDMAEHLKQRCEELGVNVDAFLKYFKATSFLTFPDHEYERANGKLDEKAEQKQREVVARSVGAKLKGGA